MGQSRQRTRKLRWLVVMALLVAVVAIAVRHFSAPPRMNVLLVTLDTTRADRIGCYGHTRAQTPAIDALAGRGVLFERAYTPVPLTLPAHTSLLTGLLPPEHGVRLNGAARLAAEVPTLAEALSTAGYRTGAFIAAIVLARKHGLDAGFATYSDDLSQAEPTMDQSHVYRDGRFVADAALAWLDDNDSRPFFCWMHLYDPHDPYLEHAETFGDTFSDRAYDAEIAYADRQIARVLDQLEEAGELEHTLVVVVGDHGESLGEHGELTHGFMIYEEALHVPLVMAGPGVPAGRRESGAVSLVDVFPTLTELLELPPPVEISGRSLTSAFTEKGLPTMPQYAESMQPIHEANWAPLQCLVDGGWKYIRTRVPELYDLTSDADEAQNLADSEPERLAAMESAMEDVEAGMRIHESAATSLAPEERRALESLGYVAGTGTTPDAEQIENLHDIKDMIGVLNQYRLAVELVHARRWEDAAKILEGVTSRAPDYFKAQSNLATCYAQQQRFDEAAAVFERALELQPDVTLMIDLAKVRIMQDKGDAAIPILQQAVELDPHSAPVQFFLGEAYRTAGRPEAARTAYTAALELDPRFGPALQALQSLPGSR